MSNSEYYHQKMLNKRFKIFKAQDAKNGHFDVSFEIEGKVLHAHKIFLTSASETMNLWLSSRWTKTDEPVKIETYSYENFYQFLCFIYSGHGALTDESIFLLIDMAEFFAVQDFKEYCAEYLCYMTAETIEELYEISEKYSLPKLLFSIKNFIRYSKNEIFETETFFNYKKSFIVFLSTLARDPDYLAENRYEGCIYQKESEFFEFVYQWLEHHVMKRKHDDSFNLQEAVKTELYTLIPHPKFSLMNLHFLRGFVLEKGFLLSPDAIGNFFMAYENSKLYDNQENLFRSVYNLAIKQALKKQATAARSNENFNATVSIKADLAKVIPRVKFYQMSKKFLMDFVVGNGILTEEQASQVDDTFVKIENNGQIISGEFKDIIGLRDVIETCYGMCCSSTKLRFKQLKFPLPSTPSTVSKMKGVDWYFCLEEDGVLTFKYHTMVRRNDYLLAEMKSDTKFKLSSAEMSRLTVFYSNFGAI